MNLDRRKQRKEEQRQKAMLVIILRGVMCVVLALSVFSYEFSGTPVGQTAPGSHILQGYRTILR